MLPELVINLFARRLNTGQNRVGGAKKIASACSTSPTSAHGFGRPVNRAFPPSPIDRRLGQATCGADFDGREGSASTILKVQPQASWLI
ncbi:hypothetical protein PSTT_01818, partial [Puccinia striiformis]